MPREDLLPAPEDRLFAVEQEVQVLCHCHWQSERSSRTTLIIVHGLEGSSESKYVIGTGNKAWALGMNVVTSTTGRSVLVGAGMAYDACGREIYSWHPNGIHGSKLATLLGKRRDGVTATARNWNTVTRLLELADG